MKTAASGLVVGLGLVQLLRLAYAEVPDVGVGAVHPICDPSASECISSDEQVQDDLLAELDADDQIVAGEQLKQNQYINAACYACVSRVCL